MKKVLITDKVHPLLIDGLRELGFTVDYDVSVNLEILPNIIEHYVGLIINSKIIMSKEMIDLGKNLLFIGRLGSGMEIIDKKYAESKRIAVLNSPEGNRNAVAEHAIGMMLTFSNHLIRADKEVRNLQWNREKNRGFELQGQTIGIIGFGHTGERLARKLKNWEMNILVYDKYKENYTDDLSFVTRCNLDDIMDKADIISFHLPLTPETKHFAQDDFFENLKKCPLIVNTSRGNVIKTESLLKALDYKQIRGACLDVFENENPQQYSEKEINIYNQLFEYHNVILSPHVAGWTTQSLEGLAKILLDKIKNLGLKVD
jgi:D-3-phosphoglycerate dehydrogenase / 2-oxoglutarate reductase